MLCTLAGLGWVACGTPESLPAAPPEPTWPPDVQDRSPEVAEALAEADVPGLGAALIHGGNIVAAGFAGERAMNQGQRPGFNDRWHLGSVTKSITATLAASLVADGTLSWDRSVQSVFPQATDPWRTVTLADLVQQRAGVPDLTIEIVTWRFEKDPVLTRRAWADSTVLNGAPENYGAFHYRNANYVLAGAFIEAATQKSWETLVAERIFTPLGMTDAGFGPPAGSGVPWGHVDAPWGRSALPPNAPVADNPAALGPAGTVHANFTDWARFASAHLARASGTPHVGWEDPAYNLLHTPPDGQEYAAGWIRWDRREWAGGPVLWHNGTNGYWYALQVLAPAKNAAGICAANALANFASEKACFTLLSKWIEALPPS